MNDDEPTLPDWIEIDGANINLDLEQVNADGVNINLKQLDFNIPIGIDNFMEEPRVLIYQPGSEEPAHVITLKDEK